MGEPNNHNDAEHCTEIYFYPGRRWNDAHCASYKDWYCQIRKGKRKKGKKNPEEEVCQSPRLIKAFSSWISCIQVRLLNRSRPMFQKVSFSFTLMIMTIKTNRFIHCRIFF